MDCVDPADFIDLLDKSLTWLDETTYSSDICAALRTRILLRRTLLLDFSKGADKWHTGAVAEWQSSLTLLEQVEKSHGTGKSVPEVWSSSIQRKLASQVPPRPILKNPFPHAVRDLRQLCNETNDILQLLRYESATNQMVRMVK